MQINQPSNVIKLTNVSIVRLKKGGKRFEIACFKNKVKEWRSGAEKDLSEVLQISQVFNNVSKGQIAASDDLQKCFGSTDVDKIVIEILKKGELQVGEKERSHELEGLRREIATLVAEKCVDPETQKPHTVTMIEKAMAEVHFAAHTNKSAKSQALELIKTLQEAKVISIARAQMRVRVTTPAKEGKRLKDKVMSHVAKVEDEDWSSTEWELVAQIDPGAFKAINDLLSAEDRTGNSRIETLSFSVTAGDDDFQ